MTQKQIDENKKEFEKLQKIGKIETTVQEAKYIINEYVCACFKIFDMVEGQKKNYHTLLDTANFVNTIKKKNWTYLIYLNEKKYQFNKLNDINTGEIITAIDKNIDADYLWTDKKKEILELFRYKLKLNKKEEDMLLLIKHKQNKNKKPDSKNQENYRIEYETEKMKSDIKNIEETTTQEQFNSVIINIKENIINIKK